MIVRNDIISKYPISSHILSRIVKAKRAAAPAIRRRIILFHITSCIYYIISYHIILYYIILYYIILYYIILCRLCSFSHRPVEARSGLLDPAEDHHVSYHIVHYIILYYIILYRLCSSSHRPVEARRGLLDPAVGEERLRRPVRHLARRAAH